MIHRFLIALFTTISLFADSMSPKFNSIYYIHIQDSNINVLKHYKYTRPLKLFRSDIPVETDISQEQRNSLHKLLIERPDKTGFYRLRISSQLKSFHYMVLSALPYKSEEKNQLGQLIEEFEKNASHDFSTVSELISNGSLKKYSNLINSKFSYNDFLEWTYLSKDILDKSIPLEYKIEATAIIVHEICLDILTLAFVLLPYLIFHYLSLLYLEQTIQFTTFGLVANYMIWLLCLMASLALCSSGVLFKQFILTILVYSFGAILFWQRRISTKLQFEKRQFENGHPGHEKHYG